MKDKRDRSDTAAKPPARLAEALRANLQRRKAQARSRKAGVSAGGGNAQVAREGNGPENAE